MRRSWFGLVITAGLLAPIGLGAQTVFRSTQSANLPTAAMLNAGNWLFEISHRFDSPISDGVDALWGLDGPVRNRLGLAYQAHERLLLGLQRSNFNDNLELYAKFRGFATEVGGLPVEVAAQGGVAWNTAIEEQPPGLTANEMQLYVQLLANMLFADRLAVGVAPSLLRNPAILDVDSETALSVGLHGQLYLDRTWSVLAEWIFSEERPFATRDSGTFGVEIRTRGHFFKLLVTNQALMNPTQFLAGTDNDFTDTGDWRFGFNLTRLLPF